MFVPRPVPARNLGAWLSQTMQDLARALRAPQAKWVQLDVLETEPAKPQNGMIVYADGTSWNPGSGAGIYAREAGSWVKL